MLTVKHEFRPTVEVILHHPVVVANISKYLKTTQEKTSLTKKEKGPFGLRETSKALKNMSLTEREPEEVSENTFKEKWLARLESVRQREAKLREKEDLFERRERDLAR
jgi:hypothetical protein